MKVARGERKNETAAEAEKREAAERKALMGEVLLEGADELKLMSVLDAAIVNSDLSDEGVMRALNYVADRHLGGHIHIPEPERVSFLNTLGETLMDNLPMILSAVSAPSKAPTPQDLNDYIAAHNAAPRGPAPAPVQMPTPPKN